jgi:hypothetical protein
MKRAGEGVGRVNFGNQPPGDVQTSEVAVVVRKSVCFSADHRHVEVRGSSQLVQG